MATTMRIAKVADRSGFSPATLRCHEQVDLLPAPQPTATGYRASDESVFTRLGFIARAKLLGCSLEEGAFAADLQRILAGLGSHTPDGPCDPDCGCLTDSSTAVALA